MRERDLDLAFSKCLVSSRPFRRWLLEQTGFRRWVEDARLLHNEQGAARTRPRDRQFWYRHWWCKLPNGAESETDILAVFERATNKHRFALHIENKPPRGKFTPNQPAQYAARAEFMASKLNYSEWRTVLVAPNAFQVKNDDPKKVERCSAFDCFISYEDVGHFVPQFHEVLR